MQNAKITQKELFHLLLTLVFWASIGLVIGWGVATIQQYTHPSDSLELAEIREIGNLWIGSIAGLLIGIVKVIRG